MKRVEVDDFTDFLELPASLPSALSVKCGKCNKNHRWQIFYVPRRLIQSGSRGFLITDRFARPVGRELGVPSQGVHNCARSYAATHHAPLYQLHTQYRQ